MQFRSILAVAAGLAGFAAARSLDHEAEYLKDSKDFWKRQDPVKACATGYHAIAISGDGIKNKGSTGDLNTTYAALLNLIPGVTHRNLPYPKGSPNGVAKTIVGVANLKRWLNEYESACPGTKYVIVGYSSGAIIMMDTLCGASQYPWPSSDPLDSKWASKIIAAIAFGDETFVGGQSYDRGSCTGQGRFPRQNLAGCDAFKNSLRSYCVKNDPQCCRGNNGSAHFVYPSRFAKEVNSFIVHRHHVEATNQRRSKNAFGIPVLNLLSRPRRTRRI